MNFRVKAGDTVLKNHLKTCAKNASYVSKTTQNDLINCCGQGITKRLVSAAKKAHFFSIFADEACDSSDQEQMSLVLRFYDENSLEAREEFMGFVHCSEGLTGKGLSSVILKKINKLGLDIMLCRGQGYDGAASMAGEKNGCASHILQVNSKALYTHCFSHRLNLAVSKSCTIPLVRDMMSHIKSISYFFNASEKRQCLLAKNIETHCSNSSRKKLLDVCRTRWVARIDGMALFEELFVAIVFTLEEMSLAKGDTSRDASSFLKLIHDFHFIVTLVVTRSVLDRTLPATQLLQTKNADIIDGLNVISSLKELARAMLVDAKEYHTDWYSRALELAEKVNVQESKRRTCVRQVHRPNPQYTTISDYWFKVLTNEVLIFNVAGRVI